MIARAPSLPAVPISATTTRKSLQAFEQLRFLWQEMSAGQSGWCAFFTFLTSWLRSGRVVVASYRCRRFWHLLLGRASAVSLLWMWPLYAWCRQVGGRHEISPGAQIGSGFRVVHASQACVVTAFARAGKNLYLTGGNVIGRRRPDTDLQPGSVWLGDDVTLGIRAMVIGPITIGDNVRIGAGTTAVKNVPSGATVVGSSPRYLAQEP